MDSPRKFSSVRKYSQVRPEPFCRVLVSMTNSSISANHNSAELAHQKSDVDRILIADDDPEIRALLQQLLKGNGYTPNQLSLVDNGRAALEAARATEFSVVLTDLGMPDMGGQELIDHLKGLSRQPVIIVLTAEDTSETIIQTMRKGVFDYLIKPVQKDDFLMKVDRAVEVSRLIGIEHRAEVERRIRLERQLEWTLWKQQVMTRASDRQDRDLFQSLHTSFSQGAGFGALLSLIHMLDSVAEERPEGYLLNHEIMQMVHEGAGYAERSLHTFEDIYQLTSNELPLEPQPVVRIHGLLTEMLAAEREAIAIKEHTVLLSDPAASFDEYVVLVHVEYLQSALTELLKNALKYSPARSQVLILMRKDKDRLFISFMNESVPVQIAPEDNSLAAPQDANDSGGLAPDSLRTRAHAQKHTVHGVPPEYERLIMEPFFRIVKTVDERYATSDSGLGLTRVQKIIQRHGGNIALFNVNDHIGTNLRVNAEIELPIST